MQTGVDFSSHCCTTSAHFSLHEQGARLRVTPLWQLTSSQSSAALLELPTEEPVDMTRLTAALALVRQPQAQVCAPHSSTHQTLTANKSVMHLCVMLLASVDSWQNVSEGLCAQWVWPGRTFFFVLNVFFFFCVAQTVA